MTFTSVAAIGAGRMGVGIAIAHALGGARTSLIDFKDRTPEEYQARADQLRADVAAVDQELRSHGLLAPDTAPLGELVSIDHGEPAAALLAAADLVYEGVPEFREAKVDALTRLADLVSPQTVIASTTSSMVPTELAEVVPHPERFLNVHWLNPAYITPLVEVSSHPGTAAEVVDRVCESLTSIGKVPVRMGSSPGYIVPRLQALIMNEAARMVAEGVATPAEIDKATRYGLGRRFAALGVLEFIDFGGADILHQATGQLGQSVDAHRYQVPDIIEELMASGQEGLRSGAGFYDHPTSTRADYRAQVLTRTIGTVRQLADLPDPELQSSERFGGRPEQ